MKLNLDASLLVYYGIGYIISVIIYLIVIYHNCKPGTGIDENDFGHALAISLVWPLIFSAIILLSPFLLGSYYIKKNGGYLVKKPTKKEKFNDDLKKVIA